MVQKVNKSPISDKKLPKSDKSNKKEKINKDSTLTRKVDDTKATKKASKRAHAQIAENTIGNSNHDSNNEAPSKKKAVKLPKSIVQTESDTAEQKPNEGRKIYVMSIEDVTHYLKSWKNNRSKWIFNWKKQVWINDNKFFKDLIPDNIWPLVVEYLASASNFAKLIVIEDSQRVIRNTKNPDEEPEKTSYERAEILIKHVKADYSEFDK